MTTDLDPRPVLTPLQRQALDAIVEFRQREGMPPTFRDVQRLLSLRSPSQAQNLVYRLSDAGYISFRPGCARTIVPIDPPTDA